MTVTLLRENGAAVVAKSFIVSPTSRFNIGFLFSGGTNATGTRLP